MNIPYVMKKCTECGEWKVASTVNFYKDKRVKYRLKPKCKECEKKHRKQRYEANREKELERDKRYYEENKEKRAEYHKQWYEANKEKMAEQKKQYYKDNKDKVSERHKRYYQANKDKVAEYSKQWYQDNRDKVLEQCKQYYEKNKDRKAEYNKQYHQSPQGQVSAFNRRQRRRTKEEQQGTGITKNQWLEMMSFFDWKCAYSSERLTKDTRSVDHIVPLNSRGDNMIWNMVPMTRSLNSSKQDKDMLEWYRKQAFYDPNRLAKIYEWQEYARKKWNKGEE